MRYPFTQAQEDSNITIQRHVSDALSASDDMFR